MQRNNGKYWWCHWDSEILIFWRMYAEYWWLTKSEQWNVNKVHMVKYIYVVNIMEFEWKHVSSWVLNLLGVEDSSCCQLWFVPHVMCTCWMFSSIYTVRDIFSRIMSLVQSFGSLWSQSLNKLFYAQFWSCSTPIN